MSGGETTKLCYNRGCGQSFDPSQNTEESCIYHPGVPVFHDAYKKWSCCEKKTTDFTEFLNIKGCTKSYHSNIKPPEIEKIKENESNSNKNEVYTYVPPQPIRPKVESQRPDVNIPMKKLQSSVNSSLKPLLEKLQNVIIGAKNDENAMTVALDTTCKNGGCKTVYKSEHSNNETCIYHSGTPVFHEGLKYWTCCVKRTTDFDSFLEQVGCTTGSHVWHKPKHPENKTNCRYDWHQTGNSVVVSVYSKCPLPDLCSIEANPVKLKLHIVFGQEKNVFDTEIPLFGMIDVESSSVTFLGSKVEIIMKKGEPLVWNDLRLPTKQVFSSPESNGAQDININDIKTI